MFGVRRNQPQLKLEGVKEESEGWDREKRGKPIYWEAFVDEREELQIGLDQEENGNGSGDGTIDRDESGLPSYGQAMKS